MESLSNLETFLLEGETGIWYHRLKIRGNNPEIRQTLLVSGHEFLNVKTDE